MKRVLIVTYYFPPSGGPGVQRMLKFVRYLPRYGWAPTVLTVDPEHASYPALDPTLAQEVPPAVPVVRTKAWDPYALYARLLGKAKHEAVSVGFTGEGTAGGRHRLGRWLRANLFLPDARVGWVPFARRAARRLHREAPFDVVVTTGPPHSTHFVGSRMQRAFGIPWVADFRDPWTDISWYGELPFTPWARRLDAHLETTVLRAADHVVTVGDTFRRLLASKTDRPLTVIPNGFDPEDFEAVREPIVEHTGFRIVHVGTLSAAQNPEGLWQAMAALRRTGACPSFRVHLVGRVDPVVVASLEAASLRDRVLLTPYVPHPEAIGYMKAADLLLLSINRVPGPEGIVPGKLFEYLASGRPVLGLGPPEGDAAALLRATGGGVMFAHDDPDAIRAYLAAQYADWEAGRRREGARPEALLPYTRPALTERLAAVLAHVTACTVRRT